MTLYKVLNLDGSAIYGTGMWSLPTRNEDGTWTPGEWMTEIEGELIPCENGYHLCNDKQVLQWLGPAIYEAEYEGECVEADDKLVVRKVRLLRRFAAWNDRTARLFACDCAECVLLLSEEKHPNDKRPRQCIEMARRYANGEATKDELTAAHAAAWDAAYAARAAAMDAARAAAWAAAHAARAAAWDAAWDAAYAARAAAWAAARDAAYDAERDWQYGRLVDYLTGVIR